MKAAVISLGSVSSKMVVYAMKQYFTKVDHISLKEIEFSVGGDEQAKLLYKGQPLPHYDCLYIKGSFRYALLLKSITQHFYGQKVFMPVAAESFVIINDKLLTHLELEKAKIPMPKTFVVATIDSGKQILNKIKYPIIIKLPQGTHGKGVMVVDTPAAATSVLDTLHSLNQPFLIQEFVDCGGEDIRCFVVGDKVVACMKRKSHDGDVRSNLHGGGKADLFEAPDRIKEIAVRAARQLNCGVCGVDVLETPKGGVVIEANVSPGLQGITKATNIDVAEAVAKYLFSKTKELLDQSPQGSVQELIKEDLITQKQVKELKEHEIISKLDFRARRVLLPDIVTTMTQFNSDDEYLVKASKNKLTVEKFSS